MSLPTSDDIARACGEWAMRLTPAAIDAFYEPRPSSRQLASFKRGFFQGSRAGLVRFFELAWEQHGACDDDNQNRILAHLASQVWQEGKRGSVFTEFEIAAFDRADLVAAMIPFARSPVVMGPEDLLALAAITDRFTVWRGGRGCVERLRAGFSWTTDRAVAERFADIGAGVGARRVLWRTVRRSDVIAFFAEREESEVVVWPSRYAWSKLWRASSADRKQS